MLNKYLPLFLRITVWLLSCAMSSAVLAQITELDINPTAFNVTLAHGDSAQYDLSITNTTITNLPIAVDGAALFSDKKMHLTALINDADIDQEYANTISAIDNHFTDYTLTELVSYDPVVVAAALENTDVLLIPEQEDCNTVGWLALAGTIQAFAENGGTVIINGTINQCIFNLGLFSGLYLGNYNGATTIETPDDPLLQGVTSPYTAQIVSYYYTIFESDWIDVLTYEGSTVAGYRNFGSGKVILIGHDYMFANSNMKRLMANAVSNAAITNQAWLYIGDDADTLSGNETVVLPLEFNAKNLFAGIYTQNLSVFAGANPTPILVPCTLTVTGTPQYAVNTPSHNFGDVPLSTAVDYTFLVTNNGSADLLINNIVAGDDAYLVSPDNALIPPNDVQAISITFAPPAVGTYNTSLTFSTNIGTYTVLLTGNGVAAPSVSIAPNSISATLQVGETTTIPITINNNGENTLNYVIDTTLFSSSPHILAYTNGIDLLGGYANVQTALNNELGVGNYDLSETSTTNPAELADALATADVFLIPPITDLNATNTFSTLSSVLQNYVSSGGKIIFLGSLLSLGQAPATVSGLFSGTFGINPIGNCEVVAPTHPIVQGVPLSYAPTSVSPIGFDNPDIIRLITQPPLIPLLPEGDVVAYRNIGTGKAIYIGADFSTYNGIDALLLGNAIRWVTNAATIWITSLPSSGTVGFPTGQGTVNILLDATGLAPGTYQTSIEISTNDPQNPLISLPVTLTVLPGLPSVLFAANVTETCSGTVSFSDLSNGDPTSWTWDFGDGTTSNEQNPTHTYAIDGIYSVSLTACNDLGCNEITQTNYIEVGLSPDCAILNIPENSIFLTNDCAGTLSDSGGSGDYEVGNEGVVTIAPLGATFVELTFTAFNYTTSGLPFPLPGFDHTLTIYDGADTLAPIIGSYTGNQLPNGTGNILSSGGAITLKENTSGLFGSILPAASGFSATWACQIITEVPLTNFNQTQNNPCGSTIVFADASTQYPNSWTWDFGDGTSASTQDPTHTYAANGTYTVSLTACNIIGCESTTQTVLIDDLISVDFTGSATVNVNTPTLFQTSFADVTQISWNFGDGQTAIGTLTPVHVYNAPNTYTVTLTVTNSSGCTAQATHNIVVIDPSIGINDVATNRLYSIAPNPFSDCLRLSLADTHHEQMNIRLINSLGQVVYSRDMVIPTGQILDIDTKQLPSGIYALVVTTPTQVYGETILRK